TLADGSRSLLTNDYDPDGDTLTAVLVQPPRHGTLTLSPDGTFRYVHAGAERFDDALVYLVSDGLVGSEHLTVAIAITPVNDAPVATADAVALSEGGVATTLVGGGTSLLSNDHDAEGTTLRAVLATPPAHGRLTLAPDGTFRYEHDGSE